VRPSPDAGHRPQNFTLLTRIDTAVSTPCRRRSSNLRVSTADPSLRARYQLSSSKEFARYAPFWPRSRQGNFVFEFREAQKRWVKRPPRMMTRLFSAITRTQLLCGRTLCAGPVARFAGPYLPMGLFKPKLLARTRMLRCDKFFHFIKVPDNPNTTGRSPIQHLKKLNRFFFR